MSNPNPPDQTIGVEELTVATGEGDIIDGGRKVDIPNDGVYPWQRNKVVAEWVYNETLSGYAPGERVAIDVGNATYEGFVVGFSHSDPRVIDVRVPELEMQITTDYKKTNAAKQTNE